MPTKTVPGAIAALMLTGGSAPAGDRLVMSRWGPPAHGIQTHTRPHLIEMTAAAKDGRATGKLRPVLAPPPAQMNQVRGGAVDTSDISHEHQPRRFTNDKQRTQPGVEAIAVAAANRARFDAHLAELNGHRAVKMIAAHTHGPEPVQTSAPLFAVLILLIYRVLGCEIESLSTRPLTGPIVFPLSFDPIRFGIAVEKIARIPPVGPNVFVPKGVVSAVSTRTVFQGVTRFWIASIARMALIGARLILALHLP
ncbi:MAG: TRAP transporter large permease subunit, partial [Pseudomonadota bacterium]